MKDIRSRVFLILLTLVSHTFVGCQDTRVVETDSALFAQFGLLLERSMTFVSQNPEFAGQVDAFIDTCTEYNAQSEARMNPFVDREPIMLQPYLFDSSFNKAIIMVLTREKDSQDSPLDYVRFVLGTGKDGNWNFRLKERYVRSFSYIHGYPRLSDTEISMRTVRTFIDIGLMPIDELRINDAFFDRKSW